MPTSKLMHVQAKHEKNLHSSMTLEYGLKYTKHYNLSKGIRNIQSQPITTRSSGLQNVKSILKLSSDNMGYNLQVLKSTMSFGESYNQRYIKQKSIDG